MAGNDRWNLNRVGRAAAATTVPGQPPAYGLAFDLGTRTAPVMSTEQYQSMMRDFATRTATQELESSVQYMTELESARNYQETGYFLANQQFMNAEDEDPTWLGEKLGLSTNLGLDDVMTGVNLFKSRASDTMSALGRDPERFIPVLGGYFGSDAPQTDYEAYKANGGFLTEEDFNSFDEKTRAYLVARGEGNANVGEFLALPGIEQAAQAFTTAYRGLQVPFIMSGRAGLNPVDPMWLQSGEWASAWRKSQDMSLGNAIVDSILQPWVGEEKVDRWKRDSAIYQLTSLGTELGAGWYLDPGVIIGQGYGAAARLSRFEMPLNEQGRAYRATAQALQRETITVGGLAGQFGKYSAKRINTRWGDVAAYARNNTFSDFANLRMFRHRDIDGSAAASALYWAFREAPDRASVNLADFVAKAPGEKIGLNYPDVPTLTQQLLHGDPKAYDDFARLKSAAPEELEKFAPGAQTFIDAIEATKTKIPQLQKEIEDLEKLDYKSPFHEWSVHTEIDRKLADIEEADEILNRYEGYGQWLDTMSNNPKVSQVNAKRGLFMDNQFGKMHAVTRYTRPMWIKKANTAEMHNVDSGTMSIRRQFEQFDHLFGYTDELALDDYLQRWITAKTSADRYATMRELEEVHLIQAAAQKFDVDPEAVRVIYDKIIAEQNRVMEGIRRGQEHVFSTAPTLGDRLSDPSSDIGLIARDPDTGMVTLELMDNGQRHTVTVPESALEMKQTGPIDPTQTYNYYQPVDTRRFYLELKRNRDIVQDMSAAGVTRATAATFMDAIGTRFNALWKPAVLFRFGWPMRVLMDENMRAMAVLGIPAFGRYYGEAYGKAANNAAVRTTQAASNRLNAAVHNPLWMRRTGRKEMNIGPGPVAKAQRYTNDPVARDTELLDTPRVPEAYVPVLDNARYTQVAAFTADYEAWNRRFLKKQAWDREMNKRISDQPSVLDPVYDGNPADASTTLQRAIAGGLHDAGPMPWHPMNHISTAADDWVRYPNNRRKLLGSAPDAQALVFDPITGNVEQASGWAVPLRHTRLPKIENRWAPRNYLVDWYAKHRELLGSTGHRIMVDEKGDFYVARTYQNRYKRKAQEVAEFTESGGLYDLRSGKFVPLKEWNDLTPTTEAARRMFVSRETMVESTGNAPYGGPKRLEGPSTLMHGTYDELPEDLLDRHSAPLATGRMVGDGFYTTTNKEVAEGFGPNLYTIKGAKDGKTYKIFDMDKVPSQAELKRLLAWVKKVDPDRLPNFEQLVFLGQRGALYRYYSHQTGAHPWLDYMTDLHADPFAQKLLTRYLHEEKGAGALTHQGGLMTGNSNRVYVWLEPENLLVRPLYEPSGQYVPLVEWLYHPLSKEVPIPENRVLRTGTRNPLFRELHQNHRAMMEREALLKSEGKGKFKDTELIERRRRENEIMEALGLKYTKNALDDVTESGMKRYVDDHMIVESEPHMTLGQDWYVMTDPKKFGRVYDEAAAQNAAFDVETRTGGALRAQEMMVDLDPEIDFDMDLDSVHDAMLRAVLKRRDQAKGFVKTKSADGSDVFYPSAYEGHKGELMRSLISSQGTMEMLSDGHGAATSLFRRQANGHKAYQPPKMDTEALTKGTKANKKALEYFNQWGDLLNSQIAHSPIWSKMLNGWSDEKIARWLDETPEGSAVKRELGNKYVDSDLWVNEHRAKLDYYLPSKKLQRLLGKGRIDTSQLRRQIPEEDYPTVFGPDIEFLTKAGAGETVSWIADRIWHSLGTLPIDTLSRHPFARAMYDLKMKSLIAQTDSKWLDEATLSRFETEARKYAREQTRKTLWDLVDQTNFTDALRFVAPFWGAQSEAITKWAKIVADRPETVARAFMLNNAVYQNFMAVDEEGNPVERGRFDYSPTDRVIMRIPPSLRKGPFGQALETIGSIGIPIGSANTVLQGEMPILPGPGPLMTIPADKLLRMTSDTLGTEFNENFLYRWLFPIGRPQHGGIRGVLDQVSPGWGRRVMQMSEGDSGISYANLMTETAREMELENRRKGLPPPSPEEIERQARWVWGLRIFAGLVSPVQTQFRPKHQFFIDEARRYQQEQGLDWFDKFVEDYGLAMARYTTSSSNSTVGVPPTGQGMEEWSQNKTLIAKYPEWGDAIISPDAYDAEFSGDAYYAQFQLNLGPGDDTTLRESQSLRERFAAADARAGWYEFRKIDAVLDVQLEGRGLTSLQQSGAEDLAQIKANFIADLTKRNPAWREEYDNFNNDIYSRVNELEEWAFQPTFDNRPDIQGVRQYLIIREQVAAELDRYAAETGGSRSLQAAENTALRDWFYGQIGAIARANPAFAEFYGRHLSQDTLTQGSGGF